MNRGGRAVLIGFLVLVVLASSGMRAGKAAGYPTAGPLLHRSLVVLQHSVHAAHGEGVIATEICCPTRPGLLHLSGDCANSASTFSARSSVQGTISFDGKSVVPVDFHLILVGLHRMDSWTRSNATNNTWQIATSRNLRAPAADVVAWICPFMLAAQFTQRFPTRLANLGPESIHGVPVWHLQERVPIGRGGMKGTVLQSDMYLTRSSLAWLRYTSQYTQPGFKQRIVANYSRLNVPVAISAPTVGSSVP